MKPWEFGRLTPREFNALRAAYYRRQRKRLEETANWITVIVNHYPMRAKGSTLRVEQLIGFSQEQLAELKKKRDTLRAEQRVRELRRKP